MKTKEKLDIMVKKLWFSKENLNVPVYAFKDQKLNVE
jgi:hypothetical protein